MDYIILSTLFRPINLIKSQIYIYKLPFFFHGNYIVHKLFIMLMNRYVMFQRVLEH